MLSSLRARLLLWYTLILAGVIAIFAGTVSYLFWSSLVADVDEGLRASAAALVEGLQPTASGDFDLVLPPEYRQVDAAPPSQTYYAVWNREGELVDRSGVDFAIPPPRGPLTRTRDGRRELAVRAAGDAIVLVGRDLADVRSDVLAFAGTAAAGGVLALALSLVGGWFLVGRALAPIGRISQAAAAMSGGDLTARIAVERTENELEQVALALNAAFDRLHLALDNERRFTADASHELRTPLATLSAEIEWGLSRERSSEEYRRCLETARRAADRMRRVVERLLTLARADSAALSLQRAAVGLAPVVGDALAIVRPLADQKHVTIETHLDAATVVGDRDRLTDLVTNLCSNAIQYNRNGGQVSVEVWPDGTEACLRVRDTGTGIAPDDLPRVFDRFYRADRARSADSGGAGLGLAIAKWIVEAHGGRIACQSTAGQGTEVLVRLPRLV
ncbi:MAG: HAMP domain-containing histidine kinase [Acidobacteria bacterium]|nr:HAMP domain-containing histidine kinase [Acidobacteriota bacterium]